jgi:hypothetical protein
MDVSRSRPKMSGAFLLLKTVLADVYVVRLCSFSAKHLSCSCSRREEGFDYRFSSSLTHVVDKNIVEHLADPRHVHRNQSTLRPYHLARAILSGILRSPLSRQDTTAAVSVCFGGLTTTKQHIDLDPNTQTKDSSRVLPGHPQGIP